MKSVLCKICGNQNSKPLFKGKIRDGKFPQLTSHDCHILKCEKCSAAYLQEAIMDPENFYGSDQYRKDVDGENLVSSYHNNHDSEQLRHILFTSTGSFRNKVIADIGCGGGSFLDLASGMAKEAVAIEPNKEFQKYLRERGYKTFDYAKEALSQYRAGIDQIHCFSVVEHINDPLNFLKDLHLLLKDNGQIIISTPNTDDLLLDVLPDQYPNFYFRKVHSWYFNKDSFKNLLHAAGFSKVEILPFQRFGLGNFIGWLKQGRPTGDGSYDFITDTMDKVWKSELEKSFKCDYLFAKASK